MPINHLYDDGVLVTDELLTSKMQEAERHAQAGKRVLGVLFLDAYVFRCGQARAKKAAKTHTVSVRLGEQVPASQEAAKPRNGGVRGGREGGKKYDSTSGEEEKTRETGDGGREEGSKARRSSRRRWVRECEEQ